MSIKSLVNTARDLGVVVEGLDRSELEKEIDEVARAQSMKMTTPLEWFVLDLNIDIPLRGALEHAVALADPSAFTYQSKAAERRAKKATDGKDVVAEMDNAGRELLERMAGETSFAQRLATATPLKFQIHTDDAAIERKFPNLAWPELSDMPVATGPVLVKVFAGKQPPVVVQTVSGGVIGAQVLCAVHEQLKKHWDEMLGSDDEDTKAEGLRELATFQDKGAVISAKFSFRRVGNVYYLEWQNNSVVVGEKRPRE